MIGLRSEIMLSRAIQPDLGTIVRSAPSSVLLEMLLQLTSPDINIT